MKNCLSAPPPRPGIRGALIFILCVLIIQAVVPVATLVDAIIGETEASYVWESLAVEGVPSIAASAAYFIFSLFALFVEIFAPILVIIAFVTKRRHFVTIYLSTVLFLYVVWYVNVGLEYLFFGGTEPVGYASKTGLAICIAIAQYMLTSRRAEVTFVN